MGTYLIAHDLGTSGDKATLFTTDGELVRSITYTYPTNFFQQHLGGTESGGLVARRL